MSLFICMECGCIENTALVSENIDVNSDYPNLHRMQMDGYDLDKEEKGEVRYLCSYCNTGVWHGEFPREQATDKEKEIASFSERNMVTPCDHPEGCISGEYDNYYVDDRYKLFVDIFGKDVNKDNNLLFRVYIEDRRNFNITCLEELKSIKDKMGSITEDNIKEAIRKSQVYSDITSIKSGTYKRVIFGYGSSKKAMMATMAGYMAMAGLDLDMYTNRTKQQCKPHWKKTQSESDKELRLKHAELKRLKKRLKKMSDKESGEYKALHMEFRDLSNVINSTYGVKR